MMYLAYALLTLQMFVGLFLIGLILLQRGRGGGLAGSFGGMGGQSAFGTKAGDIFTRVTIVVAMFWILLACANILVVRSASTGRFKPGAAGADVKKAPAVNALEGADGMGAGDAKTDQPGSAKPNAADDGEKKKKPEGAEAKSDAEAAESKKPDGEEAAPPEKKSEDAPAEAKDKDQEKPAASDSTDSKKPE